LLQQTVGRIERHGGGGKLIDMAGAADPTAHDGE
jgi:hypothetical protein